MERELDVDWKVAATRKLQFPVLYFVLECLLRVFYTALVISRLRSSQMSALSHPATNFNAVPLRTPYLHPYCLHNISLSTSGVLASEGWREGWRPSSRYIHGPWVVNALLLCVCVHSGIVQCLEILGQVGPYRTWFFCLYCQLILGFFGLFIVCLLFLAIFYCVKYSIVCSRVFVGLLRHAEKAVISI